MSAPLSERPPANSVVRCLDELGPEAANSFLGTTLVDLRGYPAARAKQEIDYGRRGKGYVFGAFRPATGEAYTQDDAGRTILNWVDFLEQVDAWIPVEAPRIYAIVDNLRTHHADDVVLFCLPHPRWEFIFQPKYAASLNWIEPWWKVLRALAFKGRRFETWQEMAAAVRAATTSWNAHTHPFLWGARRHRRPRVSRHSGIALVPHVA